MNASSKTDRKITKPFTVIAIIIFATVSLIHLMRIIMGWHISVNGIDIPMWFSAIAVVVAAILAAMLRKEMRGG